MSDATSESASVTPSPAAGGAASAADSSGVSEPGVLARAFTWRSLGLGSLLTLVLAVFVPWNDWVLGNTPLYNNYLPPVVTMVLVGLGLVVNPLLGRRRLRQAELVVVAAMLLALGGVVSSGLTRYLPTNIVRGTKLLESKPWAQSLTEQLDDDTIAALEAKARQRTAAERDRLDTNGDGTVTADETPLGATAFARVDGDGDGKLSAGEWFDHRRETDASLVPTWRWAVDADLYIGIPEVGPIQSSDPEYQHTVDQYLGGSASENPLVVRHQALVSWRDASGTAHGPLVALGGSMAETWREQGAAFLDLDDPATGAILRGLVVGQSRDGLTVTAVEPPGVAWGTWGRVLWSWLPLLAGTFIAMLALAGLVRRQWIDNERLTYPIAQVTESLLREPETGRFAPIFRQRLFWVGAAAVMLILGWKTGHFYQPDSLVVDMKLEWRLDAEGQPFSDPWYKKAPGAWGMWRPAIYFSIIAITFFLTVELSFSMWFWFVFANLLGLFLIDQGTGIKAKDFADASVGGMGMLCLLIIWVGRKHYWAVLKAACTWRGDEAAKEGAPYIYALLGGCLLMGGFFVAAGTSVMHAILGVLVILGILLVFARIVAEAGLPFLQMPSHAYPNGVLFSLTGFASPAAALLPLAIIGTTLLADPRESLLPYAVNADYLGHRAKVSMKKLHMTMLGVALVGGIIACGSLIWSFSTGDGAGKDGWPAQLIERDAFKQVAVGIKREATARGAELNDSAANRTWTGYTAGAASVGILGMLRLFFTWWPLHPIGLVTMACYPVQRVWFSIFLGWLGKTIVLRYGGTGVYQRLKPLAIGLIAGEALIVLLIIAITVLTEWLGGGSADPLKVLPG